MNVISCNVCSQNCAIAEGNVGFCGIIKNEEGKFKSINYSRITSSKLIYINDANFLNCRALVISSFGCNFKCSYCDGWDLAHYVDILAKEQGRVYATKQAETFGDKISPKEIIEYALCKSVDAIAFMYSEPLLSIDYYSEIAELSSSLMKGLKFIWFTNGYFTETSFGKVVNSADYFYINLKSMNRDYYRKQFSAELDIVLDNIKRLFITKKTIAITYTLIPDSNDSKIEFDKLSKFLIEDLKNKVPIYFEKFYPEYKMQDKHLTTDQEIQQAISRLKNNGVKQVSSR